MSPAPEDKEVSAAWDEEIRRRVAEIRGGKAEGKPAEQVFAELKGLTDDPLWRMADLAVDTGIKDLATNIDHHLYRHPKTDDSG